MDKTFANACILLQLRLESSCLFQYILDVIFAMYFCTTVLVEIMYYYRVTFEPAAVLRSVCTHMLSDLQACTLRSDTSSSRPFRRNRCRSSADSPGPPKGYLLCSENPPWAIRAWQGGNTFGIPGFDRRAASPPLITRFPQWSSLQNHTAVPTDSNPRGRGFYVLL